MAVQSKQKHNVGLIKWFKVILMMLITSTCLFRGTLRGGLSERRSHFWAQSWSLLTHNSRLIYRRKGEPDLGGSSAVWWGWGWGWVVRINCFESLSQTHKRTAHHPFCVVYLLWSRVTHLSRYRNPKDVTNKLYSGCHEWFICLGKKLNKTKKRKEWGLVHLWFCNKRKRSKNVAWQFMQQWSYSPSVSVPKPHRLFLTLQRLSRCSSCKGV